MLMQFTEMFMVDGKRSLEQMEHLAKRGKVIAIGNFKVMSALMHPKIFILNQSIKSWYNSDFFRCYIASFMVLISGLMLLNVALFTEKDFKL